MMHLVAIRRELADQAGLVQSVYCAFSQAKNIVQDQYRAGASKQHMSVITPWFSDLFAQNRAMLGEDWWPYGVAANRKAVDTFLRYGHRQGLSQRLLTSETCLSPACSTPEPPDIPGDVGQLTRLDLNRQSPRRCQRCQMAGSVESSAVDLADIAPVGGCDPVRGYSWTRSSHATHTVVPATRLISKPETLP